MAFGIGQDDSMDMGLETNVSDQASVQAGLDPSGGTSSVPSVEYNLKPGFVTNYIKSLLKTNLVRDVQRNKQGQITGVTSVHNPFSPSSIFGGITGNQPSAGIMGLVGSVVGPPGMSIAPSIVSALTGKEVTSYTGYNPDGDEETTTGGNFTQGTYNEKDSENGNIEGIPSAINKETTSDILRAYLENMDNYFELTPGNYLRRVV
jgi:hypothetical protein